MALRYLSNLLIYIFVFPMKGGHRHNPKPGQTQIPFTKVDETLEMSNVHRPKTPMQTSESAASNSPMPQHRTTGGGCTDCSLNLWESCRKTLQPFLSGITGVELPNRHRYRAASITERIASGFSTGSKRRTTCPSRPIRNLVKFHWMAPSAAGPGAWAFIHCHSGCA